MWKITAVINGIEYNARLMPDGSYQRYSGMDCKWYPVDSTLIKMTVITYSRETLETLCNDATLDDIYFERVGYRPIKDDGLSRAELIEMILEFQTELAN